MKTIILAAGKGTRLSKYTQDLPKGMLTVFGKSLIERQVDTYRASGISDISIVKGYFAKKINISGTKSYINNNFATTNMVESLFCASDELNGDIIISYGDIIFEPRILDTVLQDRHDIGVLVDLEWKDYWKARYGRVDFDTESMRFSTDLAITELGISDPPLNEIDGRYVGMIKLSPEGTEIIKSVYYTAKSAYEGKTWLNGRIFEKIFMTDFLQEIINQEYKVHAITVQKGWLEFDTNEDYEQVNEWYRNDRLSDFFIV
jgi:choline kinase